MGIFVENDKKIPYLISRQSTDTQSNTRQNKIKLKKHRMETQHQLFILGE